MIDPKKKDARIAGLWYLLMGVSGAFGIMYVPESILVSGDALATVENIRAAGPLFLLSMFSLLVSQIAFLFLVLSLDKMLREVAPRVSKLMVSLVIAGVPLAMLNALPMLAAWIFAHPGAGLDAFSPEQQNAAALLSLEIFEGGIFVSEIFWGLWLLPWGVLAIRSAWMPKWIGYFLIMGGIGYMIDCVVGLAFPGMRESLIAIMMLPLMIGELSAIGFLMFKGFRPAPRPALA